MKIAILTPYAGKVERGVENYTKELFKSFDKKHEVHVYSIFESEWTIKVGKHPLSRNFIKNYGKIFKYIPTPPGLGPLGLDDFFFGFNLYKKIIKENTKYDLIFNNAGLWSDIFCNLIRRVKKIPFISVAHGGGYIELLRLASKPDVFIALNKTNQKILNRGISKIRLIRNGINLNKFSPTGPTYTKKEIRELDGNEDAIIEHPIVFCACSFEKFRRLHLLIEAVSKLKRGTLILAGGGPLKNEVVSLGKKLLGDRFLYIGFHPYEKMPMIYRACDIYSLPSIGENSSGALIEAIACGKPVVTERDWNRIPVIGKAGILLDLNDTDKYSRAIQKVHEKNYITATKEQAEKLAWEKMIEEFEKLFEETVK